MNLIQTSSKWLCVDTDAGVDDAFGLSLLLKYSSSFGYDFKLITTTFGNVSCDQVNINVSKIKRVFNLSPTDNPKVCTGSTGPINGEPPIDATYFHGFDGLGDSDEYKFEDIDFKDYYSHHTNQIPSYATFQSNGAVESLFELCKNAYETKAEITLCMLGPFSNLALLLRKAKFESKELFGTPFCPLSSIRRVVVMGGCGNGQGNITRVAEFNVYADPEAAQEVFSYPWPRLEVVSWELTLRTPLSWPLFDSLIQYSPSNSDETLSPDQPSPPSLGPVGSFLRAICWLAYVKRRPTGGDGLSAQPQSLPAFSTSLSSLEDAPLTLPLLLPPLSTGTATPSLTLETEGLAWEGEGSKGAVICDALACALVLQPSLVTHYRLVHVEVEVGGNLTRGQTIVDWGTSFDPESTSRSRNVFWVTGMSGEGFERLIRGLFD